MTATAKLDVADVRSALRITDVVAHYQLKGRGSRRFRMNECPKCGQSSSSNAIEINPAKNTWGHFGHGKQEGGDCYGDALDLVAACESLDTKRDFARVLEIAAEIAGVDARIVSDDERAARRAERDRVAAERAAEAERQEAAMLREAKLKASRTWQRLAGGRNNFTMLAYLRSRGLDGARLVDHDYVRSDYLGNVHVPLWSLDDSEIVNVVHRVIDETNTGPKVLGLAGCPTAGTLCGRVLDITDGASVIVTEGVIDTLTAIVRWPGRVVLGAHGAGRLAGIVETVAPTIRAKGGKLVLVPDTDDVGAKAAVRAGEAALAAGLEMDRTLIVLDLGEHKDLNEAHCAGWKP